MRYVLRALFSLLRLSRQLNKERERERKGQNCYAMLHVFFSFLYISTFNLFNGGVGGGGNQRNVHSEISLKRSFTGWHTDCIYIFSKPTLYKSSGPITTKRHNKDAQGDGLTSNCVFTCTAAVMKRLKSTVCSVI
jgi:hypothetical protein